MSASYSTGVSPTAAAAGPRRLASRRAPSTRYRHRDQQRRQIQVPRVVCAENFIASKIALTPREAVGDGEEISQVKGADHREVFVS
jgi:hypothetical protein